MDVYRIRAQVNSLHKQVLDKLLAAQQRASTAELLANPNNAEALADDVIACIAHLQEMHEAVQPLYIVQAEEPSKKRGHAKHSHAHKASSASEHSSARADETSHTG